MNYFQCQKKLDGTRYIRIERNTTVFTCAVLFKLMWDMARGSISAPCNLIHTAVYPEHLIVMGLVNWLSHVEQSDSGWSNSDTGKQDCDAWLPNYFN